MIDIVFVVAGYLLGSISSAILVCRGLGLGDPRTVGSGNPGATNVLRHFGRTAAALTLSGDVLKGALPVLLGHALGLSPVTLALTGLAAFVGHLYPLYFGFKGGKGVATYAGVLFALAWPLGVAFALSWLAIAALFRYSSVAGLSASAIVPLAALVGGAPAAITLAATLMAILIFWRHRSNIRNLLTGQEDKIGRSP